MEIPSHILKKVKMLEIQTRKLVTNVLAGEYHTRFKGQGMSFADFREYVPGDDVRSISWSLTAKAGKPYIKRFDEERELTLLLAVDVSGSTEFGSKEFLKAEVLTFVAALLGFAAEKNRDQVGLLLFSDKVEHFVPPSKGRGHILRILRDLFYFKPESSKTDIKIAVDYLLGIVKKRASIFLMSDFMDEECERSLKLLSRKHDVAACVVEDPMESAFANLGLLDLQDSETGEIFTVDASSKAFQQSLAGYQQEWKNQRDRFFKSANIERILLTTEGDYSKPIVEYFKKRKRKK
jgi:uncharacterized protein (DUF58 family)